MYSQYMKEYFPSTYNEIAHTTIATIPTNITPEFHVKMTLKRSFPRRLNVEYTCVCRDASRRRLRNRNTHDSSIYLPQIGINMLHKMTNIREVL